MVIEASGGLNCVPSGDWESNQDDSGAQPKKILIIVHRRETQHGAVGQWLVANGYSLDIRCHRFGDPLPATLADHAGAIVFGGPMSANDPDDYMRAEIDWLAVPLRENKPYFGICLGAQMLAKQLGSQVTLHPDQVIEAGYCPIAPSEDGAALMRWPASVYHWHSEGFGLPSGARRLATNANFENQAVQFGPRAFGVQFHPEITLAMIHRWTAHSEHELAAPGAQPRREHVNAHHVHGVGQRAWVEGFLKLWLGHTETGR